MKPYLTSDPSRQYPRLFFFFSFLSNVFFGLKKKKIHLFNTLFMVVNVFVEGSPFGWEHIGVAYVYGFLCEFCSP